MDDPLSVDPMDKVLLNELKGLRKREEEENPENFQLLDKYVQSENVFSQVRNKNSLLGTITNFLQFGY